MNLIREIGVTSKGYGKVYRMAMRDKTLPLTAKALLSYLCAYAGSGTIAFPKRKKVLGDMGLSKDTFCKYMKLIEYAGYIIRHRVSRGVIYEISPVVIDINGSKIELKAAGYGVIPKLAVLDTRLSAKSKGLYAYLCSFAGAGKSAYPHVGTILRDLDISKNTYCKLISELVGLGYVTSIQKTKGGRFDSNLYTLNDFVAVPEIKSGAPHRDALQIVENTVENSVKSSDGQKRMSEKVIPENAASQNLGHRNTNSTLIINNNFYKEKLCETRNTRACARETVVENQIVFTRAQVKKMIGYLEIYAECIAWASAKENLGHFGTVDGKERFIRYSKSVIDEMVNQIYLFFSRCGTDLLDAKLYDLKELQSQFIQRVTVEDLSEVCLDVANRGSEIRSLKKYLRACVENLAVRAVKLYDKEVIR